MDVDRKLGSQFYYGSKGGSEERSAIDDLATFRDRSMEQQKDSEIKSRRNSQSLIGKESQKAKDSSELNNYHSVVLGNGPRNDKKDASVKNRKRVSFSIDQPHK